MEPLHYEDLPKSVEECWELLGPENHGTAIQAFIENGADKNGDDLVKYKKTLLKQWTLKNIFENLCLPQYRVRMNFKQV